MIKFRHVGYHIVDAEHGQRVRVGCDDDARNLRANIRAPGVGVRKEEPLPVSPSVRPFVVQRFSLGFERCFERIQGEMDAAVVGSIFSLREQAILFDARAGVGNILRVFV